jgi:hypothetical protein
MISFIGERAARQQRDRLFSVYRVVVLVGAHQLRNQNGRVVKTSHSSACSLSIVVVQCTCAQKRYQQGSEENGSYIIGIPGGADQIRSYHPWGYLNDESSFQPDAGESRAFTLEATRQRQYHQNKYDQTQAAARIVSPTGTVRPSRQGTDQQQN